MIDGRLGDVGLEQVALDEARAIGHAGLLRVLARQIDHVRIEFDADGGRAALRRGDDGAAVARAEIHVEVARSQLGDVEHPVDQRLRRRHPDHVLAGLADARLEFFRERCTGHDNDRQARKRQ